MFQNYSVLSRCISSDVFNLSSICSSRSVYDVYNYTTLDGFQKIVRDLTLALNNMTFDVADLCYPSVRTYMCDYFFPPCETNQPQAICEVSCENYLHNGVCANNFTDVLNYLTIINSIIVSLFNTNCSASLQPLYGVETSELSCNKLNGQYLQLCISYNCHIKMNFA